MQDNRVGGDQRHNSGANPRDCHRTKLVKKFLGVHSHVPDCLMFLIASCSWSAPTDSALAIRETVGSLPAPAGDGDRSLKVGRSPDDRRSAFGEQTGKHLLVLRLTGFDPLRPSPVHRSSNVLPRAGR
jgi:hypothetical protein